MKVDGKRHNDLAMNREDTLQMGIGESGFLGTGDKSKLRGDEKQSDWTKQKVESRDQLEKDIG